MAVSHFKSNNVVDWAATVTVFNSQGSTTTMAATDLVRPSDWNSAHQQLYTLTGNTLSNSTASGSNVIWGASGGISIIGATNSIIISGAPSVTYNMFWPYDEAVDSPQVASQGSFFVQPIHFPNVAHDRFLIRFNYSNASNSTGSQTFNFIVGIYTKNVSTLSLFDSTSTSYAITFSGTAGNQSLQAGPRMVSIPWTQTRTEGDYWMGIGLSWTTANANNTIMSFLHASKLNSTFSGIFGAASNVTIQRMLGHGRYSAATGSPPSSIAFSQISAESSVFQRPILWGMLNGSA